MSDQFTNDLIRFAAGVAIEDIPAPVVETLKKSLLDWFAVSVAASNTGPARAIRQLQHDRPQDGLGRAFYLAFLGHYLDYDDVLIESSGHPSTTILPALLCSEIASKSGPDFLTAFYVGVEALGRLGQFMGLDHYNRGFHSTATLGALATSIACAKIGDLEAEGIHHAMGISSTLSSGLLSAFGSTSKVIQVAHASQSGLLASRIASAGFEHPKEFMSSQFGFCKVLGGRGDLSTVSPLGNVHLSERLRHKMVPACFGLIGPLKLAAQVLQSTPPEKIKMAHLSVCSTFRKVCRFDNPKNGNEAKFSLPYGVSMLWSGQEIWRLENFEDTAVSDPSRIRFMERIRVSCDPALSYLSCSMQIELHSGESLRFAGSAEELHGETAPWPAILEKGRGLMQSTMTNDRIHQLESLIQNLEKVDTMSEFLEVSDLEAL